MTKPPSSPISAPMSAAGPASIERAAVVVEPEVGSMEAGGPASALTAVVEPGRCLGSCAPRWSTSRASAGTRPRARGSSRTGLARASQGAQFRPRAARRRRMGSRPTGKARCRGPTVPDMARGDPAPQACLLAGSGRTCEPGSRAAGRPAPPMAMRTPQLLQPPVPWWPSQASPRASRGRPGLEPPYAP